MPYLLIFFWTILGLYFHLDGARVFNASISLSVDVKEIAEPFYSVMFCLSKGLSAPVGSVLVGEKEFIKEARVVRKYLGGGMRQAGIIAAAGIVALKSMRERLYEDHERARRLAEEIADFSGIKVEVDRVMTNFVMIELEGIDAEEFVLKLKERKVLALPFSDSRVRFALHKDIDDEDVKKAVFAIKEVLNELKRRRK